ncbi:hypothetical protein F4861DRAFT_62506 [Xylaria intraflava]|nr:hypothetical protein F4861DRAFT_62506 [Xylaria intraflava]
MCAIDYPTHHNQYERAIYLGRALPILGTVCDSPEHRVGSELRLWSPLSSACPANNLLESLPPSIPPTIPPKTNKHIYVHTDRLCRCRRHKELCTPDQMPTSTASVDRRQTAGAAQCALRSNTFRDIRPMMRLNRSDSGASRCYSGQSPPRPNFAHFHWSRPANLACPANSVSIAVSDRSFPKQTSEVPMHPSSALSWLIVWFPV